MIVLAGLAFTGACVRASAPPPTSASSFSSSPLPPRKTGTEEKPALLPMARHFDELTCGGDTSITDSPERKEHRRRGGDACFSVAGCPPPEQPAPAEPVACPPWPIMTIEEIVRQAQLLPAEQNVVVRGRLRIATGRWWPTFASHRDTPCEEYTLTLALEATVGGDCYAIGLFPSLSCDADASRVCCDHLPLDKETAISGRLVHFPSAKSFSFTLDGRPCRLPADASP